MRTRDVLVMVVWLSMCCVVGAQPPAGGEWGHKGSMRGPGQGGGHNWQEAMIRMAANNPQFAEQTGVTEEQIQAIKDGFYKIKKAEIGLAADLELAGVEQARLMTANEIDEDAIISAAEKTGEIRTELAKQRIRKVLLIKQTLSREQAQKVRQFMAKHRPGKNKDGDRDKPQRREEWRKRMRDRAEGREGERGPEGPPERE